MPDELQTAEIPSRAAMQPASAATAVIPVQPSARVLPSWAAGALGVLTLALAVPGAIVAGFATGGLGVPPFLVAVATVCSSLAPLVGAGAYWAAGGNPLDLMPKKTGAPPEPPKQ